MHNKKRKLACEKMFSAVIEERDVTANEMQLIMRRVLKWQSEYSNIVKALACV